LGERKDLSVSAKWEETFRRWSGPASASEDEKREGTERAIREAIQAVPGLSDKVSRVFSKGSYKNNTNVRLDSDVDVAVECSDHAYFELTEQVAGWDPQDAGVIVVHSDYRPEQFKAEIEDALIGRFGASAVERGNKALHVREVSRSLAADVVPCFEFHLYYAPGKYLKGTQIWPDSGPKIHNWPDQHYERGVEKNTATGRRFKAMVRALKRLENEMVEEGFTEGPF
jgi:hypothetical protein